MEAMMAKRKTTPPARRAKVTTHTQDGDCPVAKLLREQIALHAAHRAFEEKESQEGKPEENPYKHELACLWGRIYAIEEEASWHYARSFRGMMFQLLLAHAELDTIDSFVPEESGGRQYIARLGRYLYSIMRALEVQTAVLAHECDGEYYARRDLDPLLPIDMARLEGGVSCARRSKT